MLKVSNTQYSISTLSLDIYFAGCRGPHCKGCHNPDSWKFEGEEKDALTLAKEVIKKIKENSFLIKNIMIMGGEPLDQPVEQLYVFIREVKKSKVPVWLFTRYSMEAIPFSIKVHCDYVKTGRYLEDEKVEHSTFLSYGIPLASKNQKVLKRGIDY